ncbi:MAG: choice-of-anchor Q domain-containing protein [Myxococcota bacterium]
MKREDLQDHHRPRRGSGWMLALTVVGSAALAGCEIIGGFDDFFIADDVGEGGGGGAGEGGSGGSGGGGGMVDPCDQTVAFVDGDATGRADGGSWDDAFTDLSAALAATADCPSITEVWVAAGSYRPGETADAAFALRSNLALYGGFAGSEASRDARDVVANPTILSGDVNGDDTVVDGIVTQIVGTNSFHVVTAASTDATAVLDGFTITAGSAEGAQADGGGIQCGDGAPTLRHLVVQGNVATGNGGGLYGTGTPTLEAVTFANNRADLNGGAIAVEGGSLTVRGATLRGNSAVDGAGIWLDGASSTLERIDARGNVASAVGGGLWVQGGSHVVRSSAFGGNLAASQGGGVYAAGAGIGFTGTNLTIIGNHAGVGGGLYVVGNGTVAIENSIVFRNAGGGEDGTLAANLFGTGISFASSLVQGAGGSVMWVATAGSDGGNNTDVDPLLVDTNVDPAVAPTDAFDLRPSAISPVIDAGADALVEDALDLDGGPRVGYGRVDQGAYELFAPCVEAVAFVDGDATGAGDGSSWLDAFADLQRALRHAELCAATDELWIAEGVYRPGTMPTDAFVVPRDGLALYGGFSGQEANRADRDPSAHVTVLSGDVDEDDVTEATTGITLSAADTRGNNAVHVVDVRGATNVRLDGVVITAGRSSGTLDVFDGAGVIGGPGSLTIANAILRGNSGDGFGGGLHVAGSGMVGANILTVENTAFIDNRADNGGGISIENQQFELNDVTVENNEAEFQGGGAYFLTASGTWDGGRVVGNRTTTFTPATPPRGGGGIYTNDGGFDLFNLEIVGNESGEDGGGLYARAVNGAILMENVLVTGNVANGTGGGIAIRTVSSAVLTNVTVADNSAMVAGGLFVSNTTPVALRNAIVWGNRRAVAPPGLEANVVVDGPTALSVRASIVEGSGGSAMWMSALVADGGQNLDVDPMFQAPLLVIGMPQVGGDYRLQTGSPAIDAGNGTLNTTPLDLDGNMRVQGQAIDLGAYEAQ